jgi:hypothetical protein
VFKYIVFARKQLLYNSTILHASFWAALVSGLRSVGRVASYEFCHFILHILESSIGDVLNKV